MMKKVNSSFLPIPHPNRRPADKLSALDAGLSHSVGTSGSISSIFSLEIEGVIGIEAMEAPVHLGLTGIPL
jgi:hypothetical protein